MGGLPAKQQAEDRSFFDKAKDFLGFDDDSQADNAINTARNGAVTGARLPGTGTMAAGDALLGGGPAFYSGLDAANVRFLMQDYDEYIRNDSIGSSKAYNNKQRYSAIREHIDWKKIKQQSGGDRAKAEQLLRKAYWDKNTGR